MSISAAAWRSKYPLRFHESRSADPKRGKEPEVTIMMREQEIDNGVTIAGAARPTSDTASRLSQARMLHIPFGTLTDTAAGIGRVA